MIGRAALLSIPGVLLVEIASTSNVWFEKKTKYEKIHVCLNTPKVDPLGQPLRESKCHTLPTACKQDTWDLWEHLDPFHIICLSRITKL